MGALLLAALLAVPRTALFPRAEPDELHHLVVARNLAESGAYASGHPATGMIYFDYYDSVGPTILGPIAAAFRMFGTDLRTARLLIAFSFMALCILAYFFLVPVFGHLAASLGVLFLTMAFGSGYVSRTLYGEVPALALFLAGLLCWRRAINAPRAAPMGLWAGFFFGLAVLTKTFTLVSGFAFLGILVYAWVRGRPVGWKPSLLPLVTLTAVMGLWKVVEFVYGDPTSESVSVVVYYRHWLLFAWRPSWTGLVWFANRPATTIAAVLALIVAYRHLDRKGFDPALGVLILMPILYGFWWLYFTPAHIPRFMWYGMAIAGLCSGHLVVQCLADLKRPQLGTKILAVCVAAAVLGSGLWRTAAQLNRTYTLDQMSDDYDLAEFVKTLPADATIGTTFWPVERSLNFFAGRTSKVIGEAAPDSQGFDVVIYDGMTQKIPKEVLKASRRIGRYVIVTGDV